MNSRFRAILAEEQNGKPQGRLREILQSDLPDEDVLVQVSHSTLNYKDALAVTGRGKICRFYPMVCGIDLAGVVVESRVADYRPGDRVLVNGFGLSERHWGGYSQYQRVSASWLVKIPQAFSAEQAMAIGTAGYTSMLCVQALEDHGVHANAGPVLVTGATGGVGSLAVMLLARLGFDVHAVTGRAAEHGQFLRDLGARQVLERDEFSRAAKPLESERWAGAVDSVGGEVLATVLAQTRYGGIVAACGLAGGPGLSTTVMPFILRGVTLAGIDSVMAPLPKRARAWQRLAELVDLKKLRMIYDVKPMSMVPELGAQLLGGKIRGRIVIDVGA